MIDVLWHPGVLEHDTGEGLFEHPPSPLLDVSERHPEHADRVRNMRALLRRGPIAEHLRWHDGALATEADLEEVHDPAHVAWVRDTARAGGTRLLGHTVLSPGSWDAVRAAAGTARAAVDRVLAGSPAAPAPTMALVRPPGHHAQPAVAEGYCFVNNVALAAERARALGCARVAILDWDVHHGNGTQACFWERPDVLTVSLHQRAGAWSDAHPQTGSPHEVGHGPGRGANVNVELPLGTGDLGYALAMERIVLPVLREFGPDLVLVACGQDAGAFDPNGRMQVTTDGFRTLGRLVRGLAREVAGDRLVLVQEGGYALSHAAFCLHATLEGVLELPEPLLADPLAYFGDDPAAVRPALDAVHGAIARHWRSLPVR